MKNTICITLLVVGIGFTSCRKSFDNPNGAGPEELVKTPEGMVQLMVGIKHRFAVNSNLGVSPLFNAISANGLTTGELILSAGGNTSFVQLLNGKDNLPNTNVTLTELWGTCLLVNNYCDLLNQHIATVKDQALFTNLKKFANLYRAMSIGTMAAFWEKLPIQTGPTAEFVTNQTALEFAISLLDEAAALPVTRPPGAFEPYFGTEINLQDCLLALSARYNLMAGHLDQAIQKASQVTTKSRRSFHYFNPINPNPLFIAGFTSTFAYRPKPKLGLSGSLEPILADSLRLLFYTKPSPQKGYGFGTTDADIIPVFLPGEMMLILAEAFTRKNDLVNGRRWLDSVLTKTRKQDPYELGAELLPYNAAPDKDSLLLQIYKNRCIELFMSGLKLPDSRRFLRPGPDDPSAERTRNYYPYPLQERLANPNTPKDPAG